MRKLLACFAIAVGAVVWPGEAAEGDWVRDTRTWLEYLDRLSADLSAGFNMTNAGDKPGKKHADLIYDFIRTDEAGGVLDTVLVNGGPNSVDFTLVRFSLTHAETLRFTRRP